MKGSADTIEQKRSVILDKVYNLIVETYPPETSQLLKNETDRFLNPIGYHTKNGIKVILDEIAGEMNTTKLSTALENIIKIRAVQGFAPSEAIGFIFLLKKVVGDEIRSTGCEEIKVLDELLRFETKIDKIVLMAFDIHMKCCEKIHEIKSKELNARRMIYGK